MNLTRIDALAILIGPASCDGCPHAASCEADQLACKRFETYVSGKRSWHKRRLGLPNPLVYERIFRE